MYTIQYNTIVITIVELVVAGIASLFVLFKPTYSLFCVAYRIAPVRTASLHLPEKQVSYRIAAVCNLP
jgi:hypothetical protein